MIMLNTLPPLFHAFDAKCRWRKEKSRGLLWRHYTVFTLKQQQKIFLGKQQVYREGAPKNGSALTLYIPYGRTASTKTAYEKQP